MNTFGRWLLASTILLAVSCVTINIYFPAEEIRGAADKIVDEVWGDKAKPAPPAEPAKPGSSLLLPFGISTAHAAQDIDVTTPEIRAIKEAMKERSTSLFPFLDGGQAGIDRDGLLAIRSTDGLGLKDRATLKRLVDDENSDRKRLYAEIARANGFPDKADEVQEIFAGSWRDKARAGWFLQNAKGDWVKK